MKESMKKFSNKKKIVKYNNDVMKIKLTNFLSSLFGRQHKNKLGLLKSKNRLFA
jgi:hypothetical protein